MIEVTLNGEKKSVKEGTTVAALILNEGLTRESTKGSDRAPVCGMGTCFECIGTIDGRINERTCMTSAVEGMSIDY